MGSAGEEDMSGAVANTAVLTEEDTREQSQQPTEAPDNKEFSIDPQAPTSISTNDESNTEAEEEKEEAQMNKNSSIDGVATTSGEANGTSATSSSSTPAKNEVTSSTTSSMRQNPPPFVDDPNKITLKFIFANRDGLNVILDCKPADTVGEVKGALLSMWPEEMPSCSGGDRLRLICMGKGLLMPDSKSLEDCQVPVFKTHATPVNVSVKPENAGGGSSLSSKKISLLSGIGGGGGGGGNSGGNRSGSASNGGGAGASGNGGGGRDGRNNSNTADTGCACVIL